MSKNFILSPITFSFIREEIIKTMNLATYCNYFLKK